jgi:cytochrome c oxidase subunit 2
VPARADTRAPYEHLFSLYVPIAVVVFAVVVLVLAIVAVRFRAHPGRQPSQRSRAPRLELSCALSLALISALLLWRSFAEMSGTSDPASIRSAALGLGSEQGGLTIAVVASRWNWRLLYPGGVVQTGDGGAHFATLVVPAGRTVRFRLTSRDVVHALWIPALRVKYDAMPAYVNRFALRFAPGLDYTTVRCSEFCGELHDQMRMRVEVREPAAFDAWLRARRGTAR